MKSFTPEILIEICHNCKAHQWCTRHNEQTYENISVQVSKAIKDKIPHADIKVTKVQGDKIGSFEVFCNQFQIFSKRALGYFPHAEAVTLRIIDFLDGKLQNRLSSPIKRRPDTGQFNSPVKKVVKAPTQKEIGQNKSKKTQTPKIIKQQPKVEPKKEVKTPVIKKEYAPKPKKQQAKPKKEQPKPQVKKQQKKEEKIQAKLQEVKLKIQEKQQEKVEEKKSVQTPVEPVQEAKDVEKAVVTEEKDEEKILQKETEKMSPEQTKQEVNKEEQPAEQSKESQTHIQKVEQLKQEPKEQPKQEVKEEPKPVPVQQPKKEQSKQQTLQTKQPPTRQKPRSQVQITVQQDGQKQSATVKYQDFERQIQKCFLKLDINEDKTLEPEEVDKLSDWFLKELDMEMSPEAKKYFDQCFMKLMKKDNDGKLTMEEFKKICWEILAVGEGQDGEEEAN